MCKFVKSESTNGLVLNLLFSTSIGFCNTTLIIIPPCCLPVLLSSTVLSYPRFSLLMRPMLSIVRLHIFSIRHKFHRFIAFHSVMVVFCNGFSVGGNSDSVPCMLSFRRVLEYYLHVSRTFCSSVIMFLAGSTHYVHQETRSAKHSGGASTTTLATREVAYQLQDSCTRVPRPSWSGACVRINVHYAIRTTSRPKINW